MFRAAVHDAWSRNERVNLALLALVSDEDFDLKPGKGKTLRSNFTHLVSVRRLWAQPTCPAEANAIPVLDWKTATRTQIVEGLNASGLAMEALFAKMSDKSESKTISFLAYCLAHEANHRAQIEIALRINDREPDEKALYGLWDIWTRN